MESNTHMEEGTSPGAPPKFSRYRSVRAKTAPETQPPPPLPGAVEQSPDFKRAPSRYRRNRSGTTTDTAPPPLPHSPPQSSPNAKVVPKYHGQESHATTARPNPVLEHRQRARTNTGPSYAHAHTEKTQHRERRTNTNTTASTRPPTASRSYDEAREEARMILEGEFDRMQKLKRMPTQQISHPGNAAPTMRRNPHAARKSIEVVAEQPQKVQRSPTKETRQVKSPPQGEDEPEERKGPRMKNIRQFIVGNGGNAPPQLQKQEVEHARNPSQPVDLDKPPKTVQTSTPLTCAPEAVRAFDAPISAVNAGDRRVEVKCNQASITLPVTPSTTVKDLLNSASVVMSEEVDPTTAVLLEAFSYLGLERPLRRYERVRDVMNSWNTDDQHHLVIMASADCSATGLELKDAPNYQPLSTKVQMYHSSGPGKWDKRWLNLREDGQVTVSKQESGKESTNICHLSDFDVYTPTTKQKKILKTPKKIAFAVKSQQKAAMFLEGQNFAHFFSSNQKEDMDRWYKALHSWRSWYLVNILGEGQKKAPQPQMLSLDIQRRPSTSHSQETVPYQLGSFKPLLDLGDLRFGSDERNDRPSLDIQSRAPQRLPRSQAMPPSSFPQQLFPGAADSTGRGEDDNQPFTGTGLLARNASRRTQGGSGTGRSVAGVKGKPLVNLAAESEFADGSLLQKLEAWNVQNGDAEPKIDREKRVEASVRVGEGT